MQLRNRENNMDNSICKYCTGCRTCELLCPQKAITLKEDEEGFLVASIDKSKCINCDLCRKRCPQNLNIVNQQYNGKAYAAQIKDEKILKDSTSGGFFSALAIETINYGGIVFGATIDENLFVYHISIDNLEDLELLRGSKYVYSDTLATFKEVKEHLENNRYVLYSGLPCQIAGLKSFLKKDFEKLITVDVICHGTPNYKLFKIYKDGIEKKLKSKISKYKFRDKQKKGWGVYWSYKYRNGMKQKSGGLYDDPYISCFINGTANKEACYQCKYIGFKKRPGDITIGDYWGIDIFHPKMASNKGVSAIIINSNKANKLIDKALKRCIFIETKKENISKYNKSLIENIKRPKKRDSIYIGINELDSLEFLNKNLKMSYKLIIKTKIRLMIPYKLRVKIKKVLSKKYRRI